MSTAYWREQKSIDEYIKEHAPISFTLEQNFWTIDGKDRHGWRVLLEWDITRKVWHRPGIRREVPARKYCEHVHRTEYAAQECGNKAIGRKS